MNAYDVGEYERLVSRCKKLKIKIEQSGASFRLSSGKKGFGEFETVRDALMFVFGFDAGTATLGSKEG